MDNFTRLISLFMHRLLFNYQLSEVKKYSSQEAKPYKKQCIAPYWIVIT